MCYAFVNPIPGLVYSAWKTIKIEPPNVAFTSFSLSAPELRVAYFCQPYKMYIFWSLAAPKTCRHWLIHPVQEIIITGIHGADSDLCLHVVSPWIAFAGEGYSFLSPPCLFSLYFKHSRKEKKKTKTNSYWNIPVHVSEAFKANVHFPFEKSLRRDFTDGPVFKIHVSNAEGTPCSGG